ncbi:MAG TPA: DUF3458 domain-containing protein, partial [Pseudomonadales bacterium]|nr:DUF3458 domain-containing protein [Pseudomonadales bacterium]
MEHYDAEAQVFTLSLAQSCPATPGQPQKQPFHIPVALGLVSPDGREMLGAAGQANGFEIGVENGSAVENPRGDGTLIAHLKTNVATLRFTNVAERPVLSFLRDFSAPVKVRMERTLEDLAFLMVHDADGFARWDAAQDFYSRVLLARVAEADAPIPPIFDEVVGRLLAGAADAADDGEAKALFAAMLVLPSSEYLGQQMAVVDVDGIHAAREGMRAHLASTFAADWAALYAANGSDAAYAPDAVGIARRSLRNLALAYLALGGSDGVQTAQAQYASADNMTDRLSALRCIAWNDKGDAAATALADFLERYRKEARVVDQWFATQALDGSEGTLDRVKALTEHEAFDQRNPNKVRSLIGAFCAQNAVR